MVNKELARQEIEDLLSQIALGRRVAFDDLYERTSAKLYGVALYILNNRAEADEALQDAFMKVWRKADTFRPGTASPMSWLISITRNAAIDIYRRRRPGDGDEAEMDEMEDDRASPEDHAAMRSDAARLHHCLGTLEPEKAKLVRDAYFTGRTYAELSTTMKTPLNTIKTWMRRSLATLRTCLETKPEPQGESS
ncbi:sigma-70 family RNA polymerase sigma factor [Parvularcula sp. LCG005]|uniref:sigma-70 family RNA polymerase sigma factor n=1 Tax=Parvularcula sp. LCG005 TaxID=3078805 RepID=UPI002942566B|nr:sigma-70 family RNA polymerase sigma factor [Parvularcula sp. LCG005]WOI54357.1 sigma-70 family RNA polymerase sigma factor [Parvularcula sp. LCG005]